MRTNEPESLWRFGEPEPWRRGRTALVIFAATAFVFQVLILGSYILIRNIEQVLLQGSAALLFWLLGSRPLFIFSQNTSRKHVVGVTP